MVTNTKDILRLHDKLNFFIDTFITLSEKSHLSYLLLMITGSTKENLTIYLVIVTLERNS